MFTKHSMHRFSCLLAQQTQHCLDSTNKQNWKIRSNKDRKSVHIQHNHVFIGFSINNKERKLN
jgi:hypothetical protein